MKTSLYSMIRTLVNLGFVRCFHHVRTKLQFALFSKLVWLLPKQIIVGDGVKVQSLAIFYCEQFARISIGSRTLIYEKALIEARGNGSISIGEESILGDIKIYCRNNISIGDGFLCSWGTMIQDYNAHSTNPTQRREELRCIVSGKKFEFSYPTEAIKIGNNVWLGSYVTVLKGANIGDNCIVSPNSVVLRGEYPPNSIISGNPATVKAQVQKV